MSCLVVGYGNLTRSDDGVGIRFISELEIPKISGVDTYCTQQLQPELIEEFKNYDRVIFVDAAETGPEIYLGRIGSEDDAGRSSSHHTAPGVLLKLMRELFGKSPDAWLCSIRGENFEFGEELSPETWARMKKAVKMVQALYVEDYSHA